jgi:hypothetical protein
MLCEAWLRYAEQRVHPGLGDGDRDAQHVALAERIDADGGEHGASLLRRSSRFGCEGRIVRDAVLAGSLVARVEEEIAEAAKRALSPAAASSWCSTLPHLSPRCLGCEPST